MGASRTMINFELEELQKYYHLPLREAAKRLGSCEAVIKRVCRRHHIPRWPYRQVYSKLIKIQQLSKYIVHVRHGGQQQRTQEKIRRLTNEYLALVGGQVPADFHQIKALTQGPSSSISTSQNSTDNNDPEATEDEEMTDISAHSLEYILN